MLIIIAGIIVSVVSAVIIHVLIKKVDKYLDADKPQ